MLTIVLGLVLCFAVITRWLWPRKSDGAEPPCYPGAIPLLGHAYLVFNKKHNYNLLRGLGDSCLKHDGVHTGMMGPVKVYVVADPEDCYTVANTCLRRSYFYNFFKEWAEAGIFCADVENWKHDRKQLVPAFSYHVLNQQIAVFNYQSRKLVKILALLAGKGPVNLEEHIVTHNMEVTCKTTLLLTNDDDEDSKVFEHTSAELMDMVAHRIINVWMHPDFIYKSTPTYEKFKELIKINREACIKLIAKRKMEIQNTKISENAAEDYDKFLPLLDIMLKLSGENNNFRGNKLIEHISTFIVGAHDTTSTAIAALLVVIGTYKKVQDKLFEELQSVFGDSKADIDKADLSKLIYMAAVIKETLRLYPVAQIIARVTEKEVKLRNYTIPAGYNVLLALEAVNRHLSWGPDADEFRPERWLEKSGIPENPNAFTGFSIGRRDCIGKRYAMMSLKITLVHLLREFRISGDIHKVEFHVAPMLKLAAGHELALELRQ